MKTITYITGNQKKAEFLQKYFGYPIDHRKIDLDEIQSLDLRKIIEHKVRQAYEIVKGPVLVEDTSFEFKALGRLPGPFIKFFLDQMSNGEICTLLNDKDRSVTALCMYGYSDGEKEMYFEGSMEGTLAHEPKGEGAFGFGKIFIPKGYTQTQAELGPEDHEVVYTTIKPIKKVKDFLATEL